MRVRRHGETYEEYLEEFCKAKYWFNHCAKSIKGYENFITGPLSFEGLKENYKDLLSLTRQMHAMQLPKVANLASQLKLYYDVDPDQAYKEWIERAKS